MSYSVVRDGDCLRHLLSKVETLYISFSGEECFGNYLDLHELYNRYTSSNFGHYLTYIEYLRTFPGVDDDNTIPSTFKGTLEYRTYINDVLEYLISFMDRSRPLTFLDRIFKELEEQWAEGVGNPEQRAKKRPRLSPKTRPKDTALLEAKVKKLCEILTRQHVYDSKTFTYLTRQGLI